MPNAVRNSDDDIMTNKHPFKLAATSTFHSWKIIMVHRCDEMHWWVVLLNT